MNSDIFHFLRENIFVYNPDLDEWYKDLGDIRIIVWQRVNNSDIWVLSYSDSEDYIYKLEGKQDQIISSMRIFQRDLKIEQLLK
jgi:hypothetical protein